MDHSHSSAIANLFCANNICFDAGIVQITAAILLAAATFAIVRPFMK